MEVGRSRNRHIMARMPEGRVAEYQGSRKIAVEKKLLRTVKIGQDGVEQTSALDESGFEIAPFRGWDEERDRIQTPRAIGAQWIPVDIVGNAVFPDSLACYLPAVG